MTNTKTMKQILDNSSMGTKETEAVYIELLNLFKRKRYTESQVDDAYDKGFKDGMRRIVNSIK